MALFQATFTTSALAPGTHAIMAVYNGDSLTQTNQSPTLTETVAPTSQSVVYVNSAWAGDANGTQIATVGGTTLTIGTNAFATIQAGIDGVAVGRDRERPGRDLCRAGLDRPVADPIRRGDLLDVCLPRRQQPAAARSQSTADRRSRSRSRA